MNGLVNDLPDTEDAIIIGAGPAGLTAAVYLGRFRRRCIVLEDGNSRARWIPTSHNIPGFTAGIGGEELLSALRAQALQYGARIRRRQVSELSVDDGVFTVRADGDTLRSRYVLLATGVRDHLPPIDGATAAVKRSLLRICPICDAYEAIDKRIAIIADGPLGAREAAFLNHYSRQITLLQIGSRSATAADASTSGPSSGSTPGDIERIPVRLSELRILEDRVTLNSDRGVREFDVVYLALGCSARHDLARSLSARCDEQGALLVNAHQETTVPGLYAAGDVVRGLNQVIVAAAESAIAATDIHNKLRGARGAAGAHGSPRARGNGHARPA